MLKVLGIHSNVAGDAGLTAGHAWLTMHFENGRSTSIGLWTSSLTESRRFVKDPTGFMLGETHDVEFGLEDEKGYTAVASRYYALEAGQAGVATKIIGEFIGWRYSNTCASWAKDVVRRLTGEELASADMLGVTDTPRALGSAILSLERKQATSLQLPKRVRGNPVQDASNSAIGLQSSVRG